MDSSARLAPLWDKGRAVWGIASRHSCTTPPRAATSSSSRCHYYVVMAYRVMAYMVMAYMVMAYMVMAYMVMAYEVMVLHHAVSSGILQLVEVPLLYSYGL